MIDNSNSHKVKVRQGCQLSTSNLLTYQGEPIRKLGREVNANIKLAPKEKSYRKVLTEASERDTGDDHDARISLKSHKWAVKVTSPQVKKIMLGDKSLLNPKLCFATNIGKIKRVKKSVIPVDKLRTETGVIIQRNHYHGADRIQKKINVDRVIGENKKQNIGHRKSTDLKTHIATNTSYLKARLKTEGTFDSTPQSLTGNDLQLIELIGQGTFGKVFKARVKKSGQLVAVKRVFQDPKYKNREVQIVSMLQGDFLMKVLGLYTTFEQGNQYLNIIMAYYEGDIFNYIRNQDTRGLALFDIKLMTYQIFRGLMFVHALNIAHRDIKPHNLLFQGKHVVICDFGSAKTLTNQPNLPYICSRCYRAPELIFGATQYTTMIDIWSVGCVILQMLNGVPLFIGDSSIDHLIEIIKVLGTPTKSQVIDMNPQYDLNDYKFPKIKKKQWIKIFPKADELLLDLLAQMMIYSPKQRLNAAQAIAHEFYDELRQQQVAVSINKRYGIDLFNFSMTQLRDQQHLIPKLLPPWMQQAKFY